MPDYLDYQRSISNELLSIKDRVKNFIDNNHWGEDGRYKEIILSHVLRHHLSKGTSVGTGFIVTESGNITKQIDIIIYRDDYPLLFKQDDFVILSAECVLGIIEVKSCVTTHIANKAIISATKNGQIINRRIFNGIFAFDKKDLNLGNESIINSLKCSGGFLNNICFGKDIFIKYWEAGMPSNNPHNHQNYAFYEIIDLAFGYFISNLIEDVHIDIHGQHISSTLKNMFYPIENTKEAHRKYTIEIEE